MPESNAAFGEIVGRELQGNSVSSQNSNAIASQTASQMGQHDPILFQLNTK